MKFQDQQFRIQLEDQVVRIRPRDLIRAFTLVEMMVTVGLLGFIVLGLTATFIQTQRAFRAGTAQTDVLESGRAVAELLSRELEQATPSRVVNATNFYVRYEADSSNTLPATVQTRTNVLSCFFFLTEYNQKWTGIGYVVAVPTNIITDTKVGTLYRFQYPSAGFTTNLSEISHRFWLAATNAIFNGSNMVNYLSDFLDPNIQNISTNLVRVADGIIDLRVLAYDMNGVPLSPTNAPKNMRIEGVPESPTIRPGQDFPVALHTNTLGIYEYTCTNNAVPAYLDLEFGILESAIWDRFKSLPDAETRARYLTQSAAHIHMFRRRIAVHNVAPEIYR